MKSVSKCNQFWLRGVFVKRWIRKIHEIRLLQVVAVLAQEVEGAHHQIEANIPKRGQSPLHNLQDPLGLVVHVHPLQRVALNLHHHNLPFREKDHNHQVT